MLIFNLWGVAREGQSVSGPACGSVVECCRPVSRAAVRIINLWGVAREGSECVWTSLRLSRRVLSTHIEGGGANH